MNTREYLELASTNQISPDELFRFMATKVPELAVLYQVTESGKKPFLAKGNAPDRRYVVAYSDSDAANVVKVDNPEYMRREEEAALPFLLKAFRSNSEGVVLNPGLPSRLFLNKAHLQQLIREYAAEQFAKMPGPWVPTMEQNVLLVEYQKGHFTVAVYLREEDASFVTQKSGGKAVQHTWSEIWDRCRHLGADAPYLHYGLPEQIMFTKEQAARFFAREQQKQIEAKQQEQAAEIASPSRPIDPQVAAGLKKLEKATIEGQGMGNGWEVCRAMAELRRIWVVVDPDGNMVILAGQDQSPIVDFFTSEAHANRLIEEARQKNPNLPPMTPRLISTKKLYRALAPRKPIVWINRGSPEAWTSIMGDTLPYVLQLMGQLQGESV
ncbi:MAG: hypothetical protein WBZ33_12220 [Thermoactinomyces sp.]